MLTRPYLTLPSFLFCALIAAGCSSSGNGDPVAAPESGSSSSADPDSGAEPEPGAGSPTTGDTPETGDATTPAQNARYRLSFQASWSAATHPLNFPDNPHFSGLIGAVHNEQVRFWEPGQIATDGIEQMAESGDRALLRDEVRVAINAGSALASIEGGGVATAPGEVSVEFEVSRQYPEISIVTMLAPSPDWFVGLHNFSLLEGNTFIEATTIELVLYDAGTDSGLRYSAADIDTNPRSVIVRVNSDPADTPFVDGQPSVGRFLLERLDSPG